MSNQYLFALGKYNQVLKQRNQYLKQLKYHQESDRVLLDVLSEGLAKSGGQVVALRYQLLHQLEGWAQELHEHISTRKEKLTFRYVSQVKTADDKTVPDYQQELLASYQQRADHEIRLRHPLSPVCPHPREPVVVHAVRHLVNRARGAVFLSHRILQFGQNHGEQKIVHWILHRFFSFAVLSSF